MTYRNNLDEESLVALVLPGSMFYVGVFCQKYGVELIEMIPNTEISPHEEFAYVFSDKLGGYTMEGIRRSVIEN